jgi:hypothetical protein
VTLFTKKNRIASWVLALRFIRKRAAGFWNRFTRSAWKSSLRFKAYSSFQKDHWRSAPRGEPDFICLDKIILELKAATALTGEHRAQVLNYLKATGYRLGLLVNFGHDPMLEWERIANTKENSLGPVTTLETKKRFFA